MDNLINAFMNYKINRLTKYGKLIYNRDNEFVNNCFNAYFKTYIDNYYYGIFNTIDDTVYSDYNLELEFKGIMQELLDDYREYELEVSNEEYNQNRKIISELKDISLEITLIDRLTFTSKDDIVGVISEFIKSHKLLEELLGDRVIKLISLVKRTYSDTCKFLSLEDNYFKIAMLNFGNNNSLKFVTLEQDVAVLNKYKKTMVSRIYKDEAFDLRKVECLVQKISLELLLGLLNNQKLDNYIIEIPSSLVSRGKVDSSVLKIIDNPIFRKYVVLGIKYNTYLNHKDAFYLDYHFACIQDFLHINDVYSKVDSIYKEGIFNYLVVSDCREKDREYFTTYQSEGMEVLVFEEE